MTVITLDLSVAFDTVNHSIMLQRLHYLFGITGDALQWIKSYFEHREQSVVIEGTTSSERRLANGVPQGSVLGPMACVTVCIHY